MIILYLDIRVSKSLKILCSKLKPLWSWWSAWSWWSGWSECSWWSLWSWWSWWSPWSSWWSWWVAWSISNGSGSSPNNLALGKPRFPPTKGKTLAKFLSDLNNQLILIILICLFCDIDVWYLGRRKKFYTYLEPKRLDPWIFTLSKFRSALSLMIKSSSVDKFRPSREVAWFLWARALSARCLSWANLAAVGIFRSRRLWGPPAPMARSVLTSTISMTCKQTADEKNTTQLITYLNSTINVA